jgi:hypothetical protein
MRSRPGASPFRRARAPSILAGEGKHFCAGLDLSEHQHRDAFGTMLHSQSWHRIFGPIHPDGGIPVIAALQGAVIGGGLELATAAHIRVAEPSTIYQLPEGRHGIYVGGGASVRVAKIIGAGRMCEMMLTGRILDCRRGPAPRPVALPGGRGRDAWPRRRSSRAASPRTRPPTIAETVAYYRERKIGLVMFTVDSEFQIGRRRIPNDEVLEAAKAKNSDMMIAFGSIDPHKGKMGVREARS